jgi:uncharacterized ferredoxin-like protein
MSVLLDNDFRSDVALDIAKKMAVAARTAPKTRGRDFILTAVIDKSSLKEISAHMVVMLEEGRGAHFFARDAENLENADALVLIGTKIEVQNLANCGLCGFTNCEEKLKHPKNPCSFNTTDLGIAIGSAVSIAADNRIDNRVMFSIGKAAKELKLLGEDAAIIFGIPLSVKGKNPFFDRKK